MKLRRFVNKKLLAMVMITTLAIPTTTFAWIGQNDIDTAIVDKMLEESSAYELRYATLSEGDKLLLINANRQLADAASKLYGRYITGNGISESEVRASFSRAQLFLMSINNQSNYQVAETALYLTSLSLIMDTGIDKLSVKEYEMVRYLQEIKFRVIERAMMNEIPQAFIPVNIKNMKFSELQSIWGQSRAYNSSEHTELEYKKEVYLDIFKAFSPEIQEIGDIPYETTNLPLKASLIYGLNSVTHMQNFLSSVLWDGTNGTSVKLYENLDAFEKSLENKYFDEETKKAGLAAISELRNIASDLEKVRIGEMNAASLMSPYRGAIVRSLNYLGGLSSRIELGK